MRLIRGPTSSNCLGRRASDVGAPTVGEALNILAVGSRARLGAVDIRVRVQSQENRQGNVAWCRLLRQGAELEVVPERVQVRDDLIKAG